MGEKGSLSINSENMFPIIKKWLYSDHDIFVREVISNACDAITKLHKLSVMGEFSMPEDYRGRIDVITDPEEKTLTFSDNGIGMTADEVREYINNIAFSGAAAFLEKYKDKANSDQIIGHFGLGFYSTFMVSELVEIDTLSCGEGAKPVHWSCDGGSEYEMEEGTRTGFGTSIILHLTEDCVEFSNYYRVKEVIEKYCSFMPTEIYLQTAGTKDTQIIRESERLPEDVVLEELEPEKKPETAAAEGAEDGKEEKPAEKRFKIKKRPELQNDIHPLWGKTPKDCTDEEYKEFYRKTFRDYKEPLFWIHLNMDYPFNLKGILYFPKLNLEYESAEGVIKLYNNQVFIADNIKEVIPEFLMLLKGVIDCPDLPLNVSRSALQNDGFVRKISDYITKKVAEKLSGMCKTDRENYEKYWDDIAPFIKYGCLRDDKFCEKMTDYILFRDLDGKYVALPDALEINKDAGADEESASEQAEAEVLDENGNPISGEAAGSGDGDRPEADKPQDRTVYYVTDPQQQSQYINMFRSQKMQAFVFDHQIDTPFMQQLEMKNEGLHFARIDAGVQDALKSRTGKKAAEELKAQEEALAKTVQKVLKNDKLKVSLTKLKNKKISSMLTVDEQARRMADMMKMYASGGMPMGLGDYAKEGQTLVLNANHPLVQYVIAHGEGEDTELICEQLYDLAQLQNAPLEPEAMTKFVARTNEIMLRIAGESS
ncbi:molecular chaperone HtpG [Lachnoclostridium sp. Marseille-P6806]|uniref:molecular chaperone HtpG n=1 Tax=Lachnoclostridium sp. Marseille-P6806 TaxID=2364793 RepID=UPI00102F7888|nr:molecular chaperone HtpG [Lachnoclostridium sp. Marseille-P6806]